MAKALGTRSVETPGEFEINGTSIKWTLGYNSQELRMNRGRGGSRRPNRGGGRFNVKPRSLNRAALSSAKQEQDQDVEDCRDDYDEVYDDVMAGIREPSPVRKSAVAAKSKWRSKAPIQRLQMSGENQEMIEEALRDLQLARTSNDHCKNVDFDVTRAQVERNEAYWKKAGDQKLVVESGTNFAADRENELQIEVDEETYSSYAVKKLLQCGFEKKRSIDALKKNNGDLGAALEYLLCGCCELNQLGKKNPAYSEETFQEAIVQRQEEAMALESIYNEAFTEVLADSVWTIKLELPFLQAEFELKNSKQNVPKQKTTRKSTEKAANACRFFQQGYCKFGDKCRLSHAKPGNETSSNETKNDSEVKDVTCMNERIGPSFLFHLEVRFCKGSLYPFEPPLVVFYSTHESVSPSGCLNVTLRLNRESKDLCDTQNPVIFCLTSLLENEEEIMSCYKMPPSEYSLPVTTKTVTPLTNSQVTVFERDLPSDKSRAVNKKVEIVQASPDVLKTQKKNRSLKQQFQQLQVNF